MGNLCGGPGDGGKVKYNPNTIFKSRHLTGDMTSLAHEEHIREHQLYQSNSSLFELSAESINEREDELVESYRVKFENQHWQKY